MAEIDAYVERWVKSEIKEISAYHVPPAGKMIKLDAMENPYQWPDSMQAEWLELMSGVDVNRYPDPQADLVKDWLRKTMPIPKQASVTLGNGSDELIQMIAMTLGGEGRCIFSLEPCFVMYPMIAKFLGMDFHSVPLNKEDFSIDLPATLRVIHQYQPAVIFLAYPNNPTGNLFAEADLLAMIDVADGVVVIDEAYAPFTDESFLPKLMDFPNVLVMRTVSKMGLAGLRLGLLIGAPAWIEQIDKTRLPYNINVLTQETASFAFKHQAVFDAQTQAIRQERDQLIVKLSQLSKIKVYPSDANFVLIRLLGHDASELHAALKNQGILVKNLHGSSPLLDQCLRITVGNEAENTQFFNAFSALL